MRRTVVEKFIRQTVNKLMNGFEVKSGNVGEGVCPRHFTIYKEPEVQSDKENCYRRAPKSVVTSHEGKVTTICHQQVQTARTIASYKPNITIRDNANKEHVR